MQTDQNIHTTPRTLISASSALLCWFYLRAEQERLSAQSCKPTHINNKETAGLQMKGSPGTQSWSTECNTHTQGYKHKCVLHTLTWSICMLKQAYGLIQYNLTHSTLTCQNHQVFFEMKLTKSSVDWWKLSQVWQCKAEGRVMLENRSFTRRVVDLVGNQKCFYLFQTATLEGRGLS